MLKERKCVLAPSHTYLYCPSCGIGSSEETYKYAYCSENCRDIFDICNKYVCGSITTLEANTKLLSCDLSDLDNFQEELKKNVRDILSFVDSSAVKIKPTSRVRKTKNGNISE